MRKNDQVEERARAAADLSRYPIDRPGTAAYRDLVAHCRAELADDGCCHLPAFLSTGAVSRIAAEADRLQDRAHRTHQTHNPYFSEAKPDLGADHPVNRFQDRTNGFVCTDLIAPDCDLWALYDWPVLTAFLSDAFDIDPLYRYADPLACMPFNTMRHGDQFPWHFDTNEFTVTFMVQPSEEGGIFEYAPNIRTAADECYDAVGAVMAGDRGPVRTLELRPGDMQLFLGRYTLHRVTRVGGTRPRHVAIPSWARIDGMVGQPHRTKQIYGRVLPVHLERAGIRADALTD
ncbi:MAG: hypothetical protein RIM72_08680 [Alphaproteobacteria bacterium]